MSSPPELAVLLPVRNAVGTIGAALHSLEQQTFFRFECVVVDDGSTDGTADVVETLVRRDSRFRLVRTEPRGIAAALMRAVDETNAPLLARQDADDLSHPERFARQVDLLTTRPDVQVVATGVEPAGVEATDGWRRYESWLAEQLTPRQIANALWIESPLPHPTVMMRRASLLAAGGYRANGWPEDYDLWLRMRTEGERMAKIPDALYRWVDSTGRASRVLPEYRPERFLECRTFHLARFLSGRSVVVWGAGRDGRRAARRLLALGVGVEAFLDIDPRKIGRPAYARPIVSAMDWLDAMGTREPGSADPSTLPVLVSDAPIVLAAVGASGARALIQAELARRGYLEGRDYLCIA